MAVGITLLTSCAPSTPLNPPHGVEKRHSAPGSTAISTDADSFVGDWGLLSVDADVFTTTDELAAISEIGFIGEVAGFTPGVFSPMTEGRGDFHPVIMEVTERRRLSGETAPSDNGKIYVALPGTVTAEELTRQIPRGTPVAAYAIDMTSTRLGDLAMSPKSGTPSGQAVYNPVHPSGIVFQYEKDGAPVLVFPMEGASVPGLTVDALAPGQPLPIFQEQR